ncbi:MAG: hypothetical protein E7571_00830 [Ruminococcaceae bacterium]|nr:hypothetical protein [Oscillospiraceae bacterium]
MRKNMTTIHEYYDAMPCPYHGGTALFVSSVISAFCTTCTTEDLDKATFSVICPVCKGQVGVVINLPKGPYDFAS